MSKEKLEKDMLDEEKAKEYALAHTYYEAEIIEGRGYSTHKAIMKSSVTIEEAFLAGLKAGRPKWHKVADGDYPPCEKGNYTISVLTDKGDIAYYSYNYDCWIAEPSSGEIDPPIVWCEIPKYTED